MKGDEFGATIWESKAAQWEEKAREAKKELEG